MLVLSRKESESIVINDEIEITVVRTGHGKVRLGVNAPRRMKILRRELYDADAREREEGGSDAA